MVDNVNMYLVTIPGAEPRNVIAPSADTAMREAAEQMGYSDIPANTECQRVRTPKSFREGHPWRAWNPCSLKSDTKEMPLRSESDAWTTKRNRAV